MHQYKRSKAAASTITTSLRSHARYLEKFDTVSCVLLRGTISLPTCQQANDVQHPEKAQNELQQIEDKIQNIEELQHQSARRESGNESSVVISFFVDISLFELCVVAIRLQQVKQSSVRPQATKDSR